MTAALKSIPEHKRSLEPDEETELRETNSRRKNKVERNKAVARFLRVVLRTGTVPEERPAELRESLVEVLKEEDDPGEKRASHNDSEFDEAVSKPDDAPTDALSDEAKPMLQRELDACIAEGNAQHSKAVR